MFKKACLSTLTVVIVTFCLVQRFSTVAVANDDSLYNNAQIDSREQELRRREEELLRAMSLSASDPSQQLNQQVTPDSPATRDAAESAITVDPETTGVTVLEVKAPETLEKSVEVAHEASPREARPAPEALRELEHHPALEPPKKTKAAPLVTTNRVRTKTYDEFPDGTTAKRLGSFYRIDRAGASSSSTSGIPHTRTVPISEIAPVEAMRPALLTSDELATIRNASTYLKTGPTRLDSSLLKIPQYSEVRIDYRSGAWYRVRTTNGVRGWVPGSALLFDANLSPRSTVRVGAVRNPSH